MRNACYGQTDSFPMDSICHARSRVAFLVYEKALRFNIINTEPKLFVNNDYRILTNELFNL